MVLQPKDFIKINKYLLKKNTDMNGEKIPEKEMRKKLRNIRIKIKKGKKQSRNIIKSSSCVYGLANPKHEDIADIINNTYGNNAEKKLKEIYESFIKLLHFESCASGDKSPTWHIHIMTGLNLPHAYTSSVNCELIIIGMCAVTQAHVTSIKIRILKCI